MQHHTLFPVCPPCHPLNQDIIYNEIGIDYNEIYLYIYIYVCVLTVYRTSRH